MDHLKEALFIVVQAAAGLFSQCDFVAYDFEAAVRNAYAQGASVSSVQHYVKEGERLSRGMDCFWPATHWAKGNESAIEVGAGPGFEGIK